MSISNNISVSGIREGSQEHACVLFSIICPGIAWIFKCHISLGASAPREWNSCLIAEQQCHLTLEHSNLQVNRGNRPLKIALGSQWNWPGSLSLFLSNSLDAVNTTEGHRQAKLQWRLSDKPSLLKEIETNQDAWKKQRTLSNLLSCSRLGSMLQVSSLDEPVTMLGWPLVMQLFLNRFCSCNQPLACFPVSNSNKTHWFVNLDFGASHTLVCHLCDLLPILVNRVCLCACVCACVSMGCISPRKVCFTAPRSEPISLSTPW